MRASPKHAQILDAKIRRMDDSNELSDLYTFISHLNGASPSRDNVHYVRYNHFPVAGDVSDEELMMNLLMELPEQFAEYYRIRDILDREGLGEK